jgi:hypothetical protein
MTAIAWVSSSLTIPEGTEPVENRRAPNLSLGRGVQGHRKWRLSLRGIVQRPTDQPWVRLLPFGCWRSFLLIHTSSRHSSRSCFACFVYRPCLSNARRIRRRPSGVFGPVLRPPCSLHRPFRITGQRQAPPLRVFAPHFLMTLRSPLVLSFLTRPRHRSWGVNLNFHFPPPGVYRRSS